MINPKYAGLCQGSYKTILHGTLRAFMFCERLDFLGLFWVGGMQISPREQGSQYPLPGDFGWLPRQTGGLDVPQLVLVCCNLPRNFSGLTSNPNLGSTGNRQSLCTTRVALTSSFITKSWGMLIVSEFFTFRS